MQAPCTQKVATVHFPLEAYILNIWWYRTQVSLKSCFLSFSGDNLFYSGHSTALILRQTADEMGWYPVEIWGL